MNADQKQWFFEQCESFVEAFDEQDDEGKASMINALEKLIDNIDQ